MKLQAIFQFFFFSLLLPHSLNHSFWGKIFISFFKYPFLSRENSTVYIFMCKLNELLRKFLSRIPICLTNVMCFFYVFAKIWPSVMNFVMIIVLNFFPQQQLTSTSSASHLWFNTYPSLQHFLSSHHLIDFHLLLLSIHSWAIMDSNWIFTFPLSTNLPSRSKVCHEMGIHEIN